MVSSLRRASSTEQKEGAETNNNKQGVSSSHHHINDIRMKEELASSVHQAEMEMDGEHNVPDTVEESSSDSVSSDENEDAEEDAHQPSSQQDNDKQDDKQQPMKDASASSRSSSAAADLLTQQEIELLNAQVKKEQHQKYLNDAFVSLETLRKSNVEVEFGGHTLIGQMIGTPKHSMEDKLDLFHGACVACLFDHKTNALVKQTEEKAALQVAAASGGGWVAALRYGRSVARSTQAVSWKHPKKSPPCLICNAPVCAKHSCPLYRKIDGITICGHCAPLFTQSFLYEVIQEDDERLQQTKLEHMLECYDRAKLLLEYAAQYIEPIATALETNKKSNDHIGLGSSGMGLMSGVTGVGAVAATAIHISALATILTPAGPPLLIASLVFGVTAAGAQGGSEVVHHYSEPNQVANKVLALFELVHCLLDIVDTIHEVLRIKQQQKLVKSQQQESNEPNHTHDEHEELVKKLLESKFDAHGRIFRRSSSLASNPSSVNLETLDDKDRTTLNSDSESSQKQQGETTNGIHDAEPNNKPIWNANKPDSVAVVTESERKMTEMDQPKATAAQEDGVVAGEDDDDKEGEPGAQDDGIQGEIVQPNKPNAKVAAAMKLAPLGDDVLNCAAKAFMAPSSNASIAVGRASTNAMKVAQFATIACGALSAATILLEGRNMHYTLKSLQAGSPCVKAQMLRKVKDEIVLLPDTNKIAAECDLFLKSEATVTATEIAALVNETEKNEEPMAVITSGRVEL